ncbi:L-amino acid N-acyltransferase YncA [Kribbella voronezhensis]|uniref:L-amino acid N-acyltransferase YncA n=1 Tax=Kribbella voronezhensis TaxID=2512212 RepID=A0A4R7TD69_9ACTN|nr:GNAT family N-acetyltransferase [Kribbella voronezhensis]TDU89709.1 L-amino acid N-acyltransferase YncA [Kribbella voronezhensis]
MIVRRLGREDAAQYRQFRLRALRDSPSAFTSTYEEEVEKPLQFTIDRLLSRGRPKDVTLGALDEDGQLLGIAGMTIEPRRQVQHKATLFGMAVAPAAAGRGIGKTLVTAIAEHGATEGLLQIGLTVTEGNERAERLYRSCGFQEWGREPQAVIVGRQPVVKIHMLRFL